MAEILFGDCLDLLPSVETGSVDMILCDLPYGTTRNKWDSIIPLEPLWEQYERVIKPNGAIVLTAQTPFDKVLGVSNLSLLRYEWIWEKPAATGFLNANKMPLKAHENVLVFYKKAPTYNPQKTTGHKPVNSYTKHTTDGTNYGATKRGISGGGSTERHPRSVQVFSSDKQKSALHATQKPVALMEYLIQTYTNPGELVLDNACGSGTTGVAAQNLGRDYLLMENDPESYSKATRRLQENYKVSAVGA